MHSIVQTVHSILVTGQAREDGRSTGRATADRCKGSVENYALLGHCIQIRGLNDLVQVRAHLETTIVSWKGEVINMGGG